ncbi:MAG: hypothetical protein AB7O97_19285 [Planctomycetota bacterium]
MQPTRRLVPSLLLPLGLLAAVAPAQTGRSGPQDVLPASSYAAAAFCGLERCTGSVDAHDAAAMVRQFLQRLPDETYQRHVGTWLTRISTQLRRGLERGGVSPTSVRALLQRPMALGVGRPTLRGMGPSLALVIDEGEAGADIDALFDLLAQVLRHEEPELREEPLQLEGAAVRMLRGGQLPTVMLAHGRGLAVLTNSEGYLREILSTAAGRQPGLAKSSALAASRDRLGAAPLVEVFVHTQPVVSMLDPLLPYEAAELGRALGVSSLDGIYAAMAPSGGGTVETLDLMLRGDPSGLLKAALSGGADLGAAAFCSDETLAFGSLHLDPLATVKAVDRLLAMLPEEARDEVQRDLGREMKGAFRQLGATPQEVQQLLAALGGSVSVAMTMGKGAVPIPEALLIVPVRDEAVVQRWIERVQQLAVAKGGVEWRSRDADGTTIHYCRLHEGVPLSPSFVLTNGYLLASTTTGVLTDALKQRDDADTSLARCRDFAAAASQNTGAAAFLHLRPSRGVENNWRMLETFALPQLDRFAEQIGFGRDALPDQEAIVRAAGEITLSVTVDADGVRLRSRSNLGLGGMVVGGAVLLDELLQRAAGKIY